MAVAWILGDAATVRGFRLAGFRGVVLGSAADARAALDRARAAEADLVVLTEEWAAALWSGAGLFGDAVRPVVAVVPSALGGRLDPTPGDQLATLVARALGLPTAATEAASDDARAR